MKLLFPLDEEPSDNEDELDPQNSDTGPPKPSQEDKIQEPAQPVTAVVSNQLTSEPVSSVQIVDEQKAGNDQMGMEAKPRGEMDQSLVQVSGLVNQNARQSKQKKKDDEVGHEAVVDAGDEYVEEAKVMNGVGGNANKGKDDGFVQEASMNCTLDEAVEGTGDKTSSDRMLEDSKEEKKMQNTAESDQDNTAEDKDWNSLDKPEVNQLVRDLEGHTDGATLGKPEVSQGTKDKEVPKDIGSVSVSSQGEGHSPVKRVDEERIADADQGAVEITKDHIDKQNQKNPEHSHVSRSKDDECEVIDQQQIPKAGGVVNKDDTALNGGDNDDDKCEMKSQPSLEQSNGFQTETESPFCDMEGEPTKTKDQDDENKGRDRERADQLVDQHDQHINQQGQQTYPESPKILTGNQQFGEEVPDTMTESQHNWQLETPAKLSEVEIQQGNKGDQGLGFQTKVAESSMEKMDGFDSVGNNANVEVEGQMTKEPETDEMESGNNGTIMSNTCLQSIAPGYATAIPGGDDTSAKGFSPNLTCEIEKVAAELVSRVLNREWLQEMVEGFDVDVDDLVTSGGEVPENNKDDASVEAVELGLNVTSKGLVNMLGNFETASGQQREDVTPSSNESHQGRHGQNVMDEKVQGSLYICMNLVELSVNIDNISYLSFSP